MLVVVAFAAAVEMELGTTGLEVCFENLVVRKWLVLMLLHAVVQSAWIASMMYSPVRLEKVRNTIKQDVSLWAVAVE